MIIRNIKKWFRYYYYASLSSSRLSSYSRKVIDLGLLQDLGLMDIGGRGGIQSKWQHLSSIVKVISFEPDEEECKRLNKEIGQENYRVECFPYAIDALSIDGKSFYVTQFPYSSGFIKADDKFLTRMAACDESNLTVKQTLNIRTISINDFLSSHDAGVINFLKIDTEGSEYDILCGASNLLNSGSLFGIESEVWFGPIKGEASANEFSNIDRILRDKGFYLFDISIQKYPRRTFPKGFIIPSAFVTFLPRFLQYTTLYLMLIPLTIIKVMKADILIYPLNIFFENNESATGQPLTGDVIYLKDPVWDLSQGKTDFPWNDESVVQLACIYDLFNLQDCAVELLITYKEHFATELPIDTLIDSLAPNIGKITLSYQKYIKWTACFPWRRLNVFRKHWTKLS